MLGLFMHAWRPGVRLTRLTISLYTTSDNYYDAVTSEHYSRREFTPLPISAL